MLPPGDPRMEGGRTQSGTPEQGQDVDAWMQRAAAAFQSSQAFLDGSKIVTDWARALANMRGEHPAGSKYYDDPYKGRSKLFRPKTGAMVRRAEAANAQAFFQTADVVAITPQNDGDPKSLAAAELFNAIVNHRLTHTIPWFLICNGAFQTARLQGVCCAKIYWDYDARRTTEERVVTDPFTGEPLLDEAGNPVTETVEATEIRQDRPWVDLIPPENLRIAEGANWLDPIGSSDFIVYRFPLSVGEIRARQKRPSGKGGQPEWLDVDPSVYATQATDTTSNLRRKREGVDRHDDTSAVEVEDARTVWVHENIVRVDGEDWHYYTIGDNALLSEPRLLSEVYLDGRPFVWGYGRVQAFSIYPQSHASLVGDLQSEINTLANLRTDHLNLSLQPRVLVSPNSGIAPPDLKSLSRVAFGATLMAVPGTVSWEVPPPFPVQSFEEANRLTTDFDDVAGGFSMSSVSDNRQIGETVGGLNIASGNGNALLEYDLRTFTETFVEPVLRKLVALERAYETDEKILALAARQAQIADKYGFDPLVDDLFRQGLIVKVAVGTGATDPASRVQKFMFALQSVMQIGGQLMQAFGPGVTESSGFQAITAEIFGAAGYKDSKRFLDFSAPNAQSPEVMQLQQQLQQLTAQLQALMTGERVEMAKIEQSREKAQIDAQVKVMDIQARAEEAEAARRLEATIEAAKLDTTRDVEALHARLALMESGQQAAQDVFAALSSLSAELNGAASGLGAAVGSIPQVDLSPVLSAIEGQGQTTNATMAMIAEALASQSQRRGMRFVRGPDGKIVAAEPLQ